MPTAAASEALPSPFGSGSMTVSAFDPFQKLLLARAYEKSGDKTSAKKAYAEVVASTAQGLDRALAYPEARKRLWAL